MKKYNAVYATYQQNPNDSISHYIYADADEDIDMMEEFLESQGVHIEQTEYIEWEQLHDGSGRHIWHEYERTQKGGTA